MPWPSQPVLQQSHIISMVTSFGVLPRFWLQVQHVEHREAIVSVLDDGCGMSPAVVEHICDRYASSRTGLGLGLPLLLAVGWIACTRRKRPKADPLLAGAQPHADPLLLGAQPQPQAGPANAP